MKTRYIIILIAMALGFLALSFSVIGLVGERESSTRSEFMDTDLFKIRILDWINQERAKNGLSAINLDDHLSNIAYKEGVKFANADTKEYEKLIGMNLTSVADSYGYQCIQEGKIQEIKGILLPSEHIKFREIEPVIEWYMSQTVKHKQSQQLLFDPDAKNIGIAISMSNEKFYVLQFLC